MRSLSSARCSLNALESTSRMSRAARLPRPQRFILPSLVARSISQRPSSSSCDASNTETSTPIVPSPPPSSTPPSFLNAQPTPHLKKPTFEFKFSSITTSDTLARVLEVRRSIPPSELALLPELEQQQRKTALSILTKASKMDPEKRAAYFKGVDAGHPPSDVLDQSRREKAKKQVESGLFEKEDALSTEEWEEDIRVRREAKLGKGGEGRERWSREKALKKLIAKDEMRRRQRKERLVVRRERKVAEEEGKGST